MHVYRNEIIDWYVASSPEEASAMCREYCERVMDLLPEEMGDRTLKFTQEPDDKVLTIRGDGDGSKEAGTCADWARKHGPGFLASTEY